MAGRGGCSTTWRGAFGRPSCRGGLAGCRRSCGVGSDARGGAVGPPNRRRRAVEECGVPALPGALGFVAVVLGEPGADQGKMERPIRNLRDSFFCGRKFASGADLNEQATRRRGSKRRRT